jgi:glutamate-ammonia-ligase adenylyltransferase
MLPLAERIASAPIPHDAALAARYRAELAAKCEADTQLEALRALIAGNAGVAALLDGVFGCSPFLTALILADPAGLAACLAAAPEHASGQIGATLTEAMAKVSRQDEAMEPLRRAKKRLALVTALADLGGVWSVDQVTAALSDGADMLVGAAVRHLLRGAALKGDLVAADPDAPETASSYIVLGMGKYGARELNYSSDIDLIVFYDMTRARLRAGIEPSPFFVRITRDLVKLMTERTPHGYVFRTDLRLRPDPGATQVALSTDAALHYYETFGQNWERAAFIKARPVAGDLQAGEDLLRDMAPYIWRKYLDYAAIADIHAMKRQIHAHKGHARLAVKGHNLKLGRGGIREIEFFVQTQQLIAGGRQRDLRMRQTIEALAGLTRREWITADAARELTASYRFLRTIEHRLQMIADEQTHSLPSDPAKFEQVAHFSGYADGEALARAVTDTLETVQRHYAALFEHVPALSPQTVPGNLVFTGDSDDPATIETLRRLGFSNPQSAISTVRGWHFGRYPAMRSARARESLTEFTPNLLEALARTAQPDLALATFDRFFADLPAGVQLFAMLRSNPALLKMLADIMGSAPRLARILSRRPRVVDAVLDPGFLGELPSEAELAELVQTALARSRSYEDCLDLARALGQEQSFLIGVAVLSGTVTAEQAGHAYAVLAEQLIRGLHTQVARLLERQHGRVPGGDVCVLGLGKLGGHEMTANSDLDLILIYDHDPAHLQTDGMKPLPAPQYFARLTQRLISALSAPTAEGQLYPVDMRLRPSGNAGPLATSLAGFVRYQNDDAWTWEHMALTRARVISGPGRLRDSITATIAEILRRPRDRAKVAADVLAMRARIEQEKGTKDIWDIKYHRGGLVDVEFVAQYFQLIHAHEQPYILDQNTVHALGKLRAANLLAESDADILLPAAHLYHDLTQVIRLCADGPFKPETAPDGLKALIAAAADLPDFPAVEALLRERLAAVAERFEALIS